MSTQPHIMAELRAARTFRDLYSLPFPAKVGTIHDRQTFDSFDKDQAHADGTTLGQTMRLAFNQIGAPAHEALSLSWDFQSHSGFAHTMQWETVMRRGEGPAPDLVKTEFLHPDSIVNPRMNIFLASNKQGTRIVSHADTLDIFEHSEMKWLLDLPLYEDAAVAFKFVAAYRHPSIEPLLIEAGREAAPNELVVIAGGTLHQKQKSVDPSRVFYKARAFAKD